MRDHQLSGNLQETPFAEVAGAIYSQKRSGALTLSSGERARTVIFHEGSPVAVISADPRDHVAALLTAKGKIGAEEAERLKALPETKEALQSADFVGQDVLMWGLKFRFVNLCYDFFRWTDGEYSFEEGAPPKGIFLMKVPTPTLLTKGVKHMPPSLLLERIASGLEVAPGAAGIEAAGALGEEEKALALLCTEGRTVQEVHEAGGTDPVRAREILYTLKALDIIDLRSPAPAVESAPEIVEDIALEDETPLELAGPGSGGEAEPPRPEAEAEPAAEPAFEIERHSYEEDAQPPPPLAEEEAEPVPPVEQDLQEGLKQADAGMDESSGGALPELETPGLDMPPLPESDGGSAPETSPELETPGLDMPSPEGGSPELTPIGFDDPAPAVKGGLEPPGEEIPPPSADLPPPPWQEETPEGPGELGVPDSGTASSPFAPPPSGGDAPREPTPSPLKDRARKPAKAKKERSLFSKLLIGVVMAVAAVVVASGLWMGSASLRSPSVPLPPIPPAEEVEMAEGLPVPALPKTLSDPAESGDPGEPAGEEPVVAAAPSEPVRETAAAESPAETPPDRTPHEAALASFEAGDHFEAAETWRTMASGSGGAWTIQVVVACQVDTVTASFERFGRERELFALPLQLSGRSCFRVCYGLFGTKGQAQASLEALPAPLQYELSVRGLKGLL